jgi:TPR repeat protein
MHARLFEQLSMICNVQFAQANYAAELSGSNNSAQTLPEPRNEAERVEHEGDKYDQGNGVARNLAKAFELYESAAAQGSASAALKVARCYIRARGTEKNDETAVKYLQLASEQGDAEAQYMLAVAYTRGQGIERNYEKAKELLIAARPWLHRNYEASVIVDLEQRKAGVQREQSPFLLAIEENCSNPEAYFRAGYFYETEKNDVKKAAELYEIAADMGHSDAQCYMGVFYGRGIAVEKNLDKSAKYFYLSSAQNHRVATYNLAVCLRDGLGVTKDLVNALHYFAKASKMGLVTAKSEGKKTALLLKQIRKKEAERKEIMQSLEQYVKTEIRFKQK